MGDTLPDSRATGVGRSLAKPVLRWWRSERACLLSQRAGCCPLCCGCCRDLKSGNLLVDQDNMVRVADFGLSRLYHGMHTMTGGLGTFQVNSVQLCGVGWCRWRRGWAAACCDSQSKPWTWLVDSCSAWWGAEAVLQRQGCVWNCCVRCPSINMCCMMQCMLCVLAPSCVPCLCAVGSQWMAPEVLANQRYSNKADIYSFGMVMWECCARQVPFEGLNGVQAGKGQAGEWAGAA